MNYFPYFSQAFSSRSCASIRHLQPSKTRFKVTPPPNSQITPATTSLCFLCKVNTAGANKARNVKKMPGKSKESNSFWGGVKLVSFFSLNVPHSFCFFPNLVSLFLLNAPHSFSPFICASLKHFTLVSFFSMCPAHLSLYKLT